MLQSETVLYFGEFVLSFNWTEWTLEKSLPWLNTKTDCNPTRFYTRQTNNALGDKNAPCILYFFKYWVKLHCFKHRGHSVSSKFPNHLACCSCYWQILPKSLGTRPLWELLFVQNIPFSPAFIACRKAVILLGFSTSLHHFQTSDLPSPLLTYYSVSTASLPWIPMLPLPSTSLSSPPTPLPKHWSQIKLNTIPGKVCACFFRQSSFRSFNRCFYYSPFKDITI